MKKIHKIKKVKKVILEVSEVANFLWLRGWAERNAGNISVNIDDLVKKDEIDLDLSEYNKYELEKSFPALSNMMFFVTGTGKRMRDTAKRPLKNALIIKLNEEGNAYWIISQRKHENNFLPTSELPTHLAIHEKLKKTGSKNKVVMHTHSNEFVALTQLKEFNNSDKINKVLLGMHPEAMIFIPKGIGFVEYDLPGTMGIADKTVEIIDKHDVVIWEKHGAFAVGEGVNDAFDMIDILAKAAKIYFMCKSAGYEPEGLSDEELAELKRVSSRYHH